MRVVGSALACLIAGVLLGCEGLELQSPVIRHEPTPVPVVSQGPQEVATTTEAAAVPGGPAETVPGILNEELEALTDFTINFDCPVRSPHQHESARWLDVRDDIVSSGAGLAAAKFTLQEYTEQHLVSFKLTAGSEVYDFSTGETTEGDWEGRTSMEMVLGTPVHESRVDTFRVYLGYNHPGGGACYICVDTPPNTDHSRDDYPHQHLRRQEVFGHCGGDRPGNT